MADAPRICDQCRYAVEPTFEPGIGRFMVCRRFPPVPDPTAKVHNDLSCAGLWPLVDRVAGCGEWKPLPGADLREP